MKIKAFLLTIGLILAQPSLNAVDFNHTQPYSPLTTIEQLQERIELFTGMRQDTLELLDHPAQVSAIIQQQDGEIPTDEVIAYHIDRMRSELIPEYDRRIADLELKLLNLELKLRMSAQGA